MDPNFGMRAYLRLGLGGIAGLAIGWRLAQAGADIEIYDRGLAGRGATSFLPPVTAGTTEPAKRRFTRRRNMRWCADESSLGLYGFARLRAAGAGGADCGGA